MKDEANNESSRPRAPPCIAYVRRRLHSRSTLRASAHHTSRSPDRWGLPSARCSQFSMEKMEFVTVMKQIDSTLPNAARSARFRILVALLLSRLSRWDEMFSLEWRHV